MTFQERSKEVAKHFLQTVVVVDDQAFLSLDESPPVITDLQIIEPKKGGKTGTKATPETGSTASPQHQTSKDPVHELDAKRLIDQFAEIGLICAVLRPNQGENPLDKTLKAAKRSDIVVLDWQIYKDDGEICIRIINDIITKDSSEGNRLRLIAIYTGEKELHKIAENISSRVTAQPYGPLHKDKDTYVRIAGPLRITVFGKNTSLSVEREQIVSQQDLPDRLISEFSKMTRGIVSNVSLNALSVLRDNTHELLSTFHSKLDAPFLAHRALLPEPDDATEHLVSLIASELRSILQEYDVGQEANEDILKAWLGTNISSLGEILDVHTQQYQEEEKSNKIIKILYNLLTSNDQTKWNNIAAQGIHKKQFLKRACELFCNSNAQKLEDEFSRLHSVKTRYKFHEPIPHLTLGTIVLKEKIYRSQTLSSNETEYLLCVQPACLSVRLKEGETNFPFIPLKVVEQGEAAHFIIKDKETFIRLQRDLKPPQCIMIPFASNQEKGKVVRASLAPFVFKSKDKRFRGRHFRWIAELTSEQAQRVTNEFASEFFRVGLNESEMFRREEKQIKT
jgi:Response receiver domain